VSLLTICRVFPAVLQCLLIAHIVQQYVVGAVHLMPARLVPVAHFVACAQGEGVAHSATIRQSYERSIGLWRHFGLRYGIAGARWDAMDHCDSWRRGCIAAAGDRSGASADDGKQRSNGVRSHRFTCPSFMIAALSHFILYLCASSRCRWQAARCCEPGGGPHPR